MATSLRLPHRTWNINVTYFFKATLSTIWFFPKFSVWFILSWFLNLLILVPQAHLLCFQFLIMQTSIFLKVFWDYWVDIRFLLIWFQENINHHSFAFTTFKWLTSDLSLIHLWVICWSLQIDFFIGRGGGGSGVSKFYVLRWSNFCWTIWALFWNFIYFMSDLWIIWYLNW